MMLPNLTYMVVAELRYIQSTYETKEHRNPDVAVRDFLSTRQRWRCDLRGRFGLGKLRLQPLYYYLIARTKHYDEVFVDAICEKVKFIVNVGCGADTRAYRFGYLLKQKGIRVVECDQAEAIHAKQLVAKRAWRTDHVEYLAIDLNDNTWPDFENWLTKNHDANMLVMMEGVSPYVNKDTFDRFLSLLATKLKPGSRVAYDFKLRESPTAFGFPDSLDVISAHHKAYGYQLEHLERSSDLTLRILPSLANSGATVYQADGVVRLVVS